MRKAPWLDYSGNFIHEGDTIRHPHGDEGIVTYHKRFDSPHDQWRVDYGDGVPSRLCLQIGDIGKAVVLTPRSH